MTLLEVIALTARCDPRRLREDAGISRSTVARALGVSPESVRNWERGLKLPQTTAGFRWARVTAALERRAEVSAELAADDPGRD